MAHLRCLLTLLALSSLGCGADDIQPVTGSWFYAEGETISDTCEVPGFSVSASTDFHLSNNGDGSFTVARDGQDIECELDGSEFDCVPVPLDPVNNDMFDATFELEVTYSGSFENEQTMMGRRVIAVSCVGTDCDAFATVLSTSFPCALVDGFDGVVN